MVFQYSAARRPAATIAAAIWVIAIGFGPVSARTLPTEPADAFAPSHAGPAAGVTRVRLADSRDRTIDYRGAYWGDRLPSAAAPPPAGRSRNPLTNFLPDPDAARRYDEWSRQTYFDGSKRLAPTGDEPGIKEKPAVTFLKLRF